MRNRLYWPGAAESARLEQRTMLSLAVTTLPIPLVALVEPEGITTGSDGNLWFTEYGAGKIGRMTPAGVLASFALPQVQPTAGSAGGMADTTPQPTAIAAGPDGALWFTGIPGEIGRITTAGVVTEFPLPAVPPTPGLIPGTVTTPAIAAAIGAGPDGALWFTGAPGEIDRISTTGVVTEFAVPDTPPPAGLAPGTALSALNAITVGPDGALWFTGLPGEVGRITTAGDVSEFPVPGLTPPSGPSPGTAGTAGTLDDITAGRDGALWFTGLPGEVGRITTKGVVTEYATPKFNVYGTNPLSLPGSGVVTIATGSDGNLWLTDGPAIGRMTPKGSFRSFNAPGNLTIINGLAPGPGGNVWFTEQELGSTRGLQSGIGEITPVGATTLHVIPRSFTLNPNLGIQADPTLITSAPDGALWFVDDFGDDPAIGRITASGEIQQFPLPEPFATIGQISAITAGRDGSVWFTDERSESLDPRPDAIGHISIKGGIAEYPLPADVGVGQSIVVAPDGDVWFTENVPASSALSKTTTIGRLTPEGAMSTFTVPVPTSAQGETLGTIANGPDGNVWFTGSYDPAQGKNNQSFIGRITVSGQIRLFELPPSFSSSSLGGDGFYFEDGYGPGYVSSLISGPNGKLWFAATDAQGTSGIAQISTSGKLGSFIPADISGDLVAGSNGQIWFPSSSGLYNVAKGILTRSGVVAAQNLPSQALSINGVDYQVVDMTFGRDGSLWLTNGTSDIVRVSGMDAVAGELDYRHRPRRAPDFAYDPTPPFTGVKSAYWTNTTSNPRPTFAGVAKPGAEVTLWAQKQGDKRPMSIGHVKASKKGGSWTLTSHVSLSNGNYAIMATESGQHGPPSVLYSLEPDSSGNLSNALVIQAPPGG
jgi:streptogramin lyase